MSDREGLDQPKPVHVGGEGGFANTMTPTEAAQWEAMENDLKRRIATGAIIRNKDADNLTEDEEEQE